MRPHESVSEITGVSEHTNERRDPMLLSEGYNTAPRAPCRPALTGVPGSTATPTRVGLSAPVRRVHAPDLRWAFYFPGSCSYFPRFPESGHMSKAETCWPHVLTLFRSATWLNFLLLRARERVSIFYDCNGPINLQFPAFSLEAVSRIFGPFC